VYLLIEWPNSIARASIIFRNPGLLIFDPVSKREQAVATSFYSNRQRKCAFTFSQDIQPFPDIGRITEIGLLLKEEIATYFDIHLNPKKMNKTISKGLRAAAVLLLLVAASCQEDDAKLDKKQEAKAGFENVILRPISDEARKAEILSMVARPDGRSQVLPPGGSGSLPSGYDYNNMQEVIIAGTNWVTYVAFSTTQNTATSKKMVGIYYVGGVYKNYTYADWNYREGKAKPYYGHIYQPVYPTNFNFLAFNPTTEETTVSRVRPPSACGQQVSDCVQNFYTGQGWYSVGLTLLTMVEPAIFVGVVGGCMGGCALGW
jgi:hypothetical protein